MYAVIESGSKQYRVEVGTELEVELLDVAPGDTITLERVLLVADGESASIGRPVVANATVSAEVVRQDRADKVIVFKYRPKARRRVKKGHRQERTILRIADIVLDGKSAAEDVRKAEKAARTERERLEEAAARQAAEDAALAATLAKSKAGAKADTKADTAEEKPTGRGRRKPATEAKRATTTKSATAAKPAKADTNIGTKASGGTTKTGGTGAKASGASDKGPAARPKRTSRTTKDD
jgi:large subunit ribosomal protein L21